MADINRTIAGAFRFSRTLELEEADQWELTTRLVRVHPRAGEPIVLPVGSVRSVKLTRRYDAKQIAPANQDQPGHRLISNNPQAVADRIELDVHILHPDTRETLYTEAFGLSRLNAEDRLRAERLAIRFNLPTSIQMTFH